MTTLAAPQLTAPPGSGTAQRGSASGQTPGFYRHDLDGLRGVAIALVAVFHVWFGRVSGGVDVFLALSGFFFGGKLLRAALEPGGRRCRRWPEVDPAGPAPAAGAGRGAGRVRACSPSWSSRRPAGRPSPTRAWPAWATTRTGSWPTPRRTTCARARRSARCSTSGRCRCRASSTSRSCCWSFGFAYAAAPSAAAGGLRASFVVLLSALTVASFVYAIFAHQADQTTAYYNSFARAWELLLGALVGALVPYVRWPMWLRTVVATRRAGGDPVLRRADRRRQGVPRPVGAGAGRRDRADDPGRRQPAGRPAHRDRMPLPNRLLATGPLVTLGAMAYSLYLWHWPLLIFWLVLHRPHARQLRSRARRSCWCPACWPT